MLEYAGNVDVSAKPHQQSLKKAPTPGLRDWRTRALGRRRRRVRGGRRATCYASSATAPSTPRPLLDGRALPGTGRGSAPGMLLRTLCGARPLGGGGTRRFLDHVAPLVGDEEPVEREVVVAVGRDPRLVLPHADVPHDLAVAAPQPERLRLQVGEEHERADDDARGEDPAADGGLPELRARPWPGSSGSGR